MSLMLRQKAQPILDGYGMSQFHVDIHKRRGEDPIMAVIGECGRPLVYMTAIQFNRRSPTVKEIDFAVELFQDWVDSHHEVLDDFKQAIQLRGKMPKLKNCPYEIKYSWSGEEVRHIQYVDDYFFYKVDVDGTLSFDLCTEFSESISKPKHIPATLIPDRVVIDDMVHIMKNFSRRWRKYEKGNKVYSAAHSAVKKCDTL